jgi:exodeoxyribonuclease VII large subunit
MFRAQARLLRFKPQNGMAVIVRGRITMYEARGEMQLMAEYMEPLGAGALQVAFEQLKAKLAAEGLFDAARKRRLPLLPRSIGVVTSPRGAVIQDILNVLRRRHESLHVLIYPAQVQGESAVAEISAGLRYFNKLQEDSPNTVDVIVLARGGGSIEDLAAFNDESLARLIAASRVPTISAVGHETDFTIADFVADLRAPTPSAAAEIVVRSQQELRESVAALHERLRRAAQYKLLYERQRLSALESQRVFGGMKDSIARRQQRIDDLGFRLESLVRARLSAAGRRLEQAVSHLRQGDLRQQLANRRSRLDWWTEALASAMRKTLQQCYARLQPAAAKVQALSPLAILERGYSLIFDAHGTLVKDAAQLAAGSAIRARLANGEIDARVEATRPTPTPRKQPE